jgi:DNA mismatch endonuclease Vsr
MGQLTKEQRRKNMQAVKSKGTKAEVMLAKALWHRGLRYRKNDRSVFGTPDLTFKRYKIAIFVDGEFWHGKDWHLRKHDHKTNIEFWHNKIERNIQRDKEVNKKLTEDGWLVIRFWSKDVLKNIESCINQIIQAIDERKQSKI